MPELPEVETVRRGLEPVMTGRVLERLDLRRGGLRTPFSEDMKDSVEGRKILALTRRAKYILIHFDGSNDGRVLAVHLGMSGQMMIVPKIDKYEMKTHDHVVFYLSGGSAVVFNDARRFGTMFVSNEDEIGQHPALKGLGPEPLEKTFTGAVLKSALTDKKVAIKIALLDQKIVAGIGNIYACEALFDAGIDPRKPAGKISAVKCEVLVKAIRHVLNRSIKAGGSTLKDYRHADGNLGYFQHSFLVYDREGEPCPRCREGGKKAHIIKRFNQGGRSTFYCPGCQK